MCLNLFNNCLKHTYFNIKTNMNLYNLYVLQIYNIYFLKKKIYIYNKHTYVYQNDILIQHEKEIVETII